jgi:hypothetical protein
MAKFTDFNSFKSFDIFEIFEILDELIIFLFDKLLIFIGNN